MSKNTVSQKLSSNNTQNNPSYRDVAHTTINTLSLKIQEAILRFEATNIEMLNFYNVIAKGHRLGIKERKQALKDSSERLKSLPRIRLEVAQPNLELTSFINHYLPSTKQSMGHFTFSTKERTPEVLPQRHQTLGILSGTVAAIFLMPEPKLIVYEQLFEKLVHCYLDAAQESLPSNILHKRVSVSGLISRNAKTGQPIEVHDVSIITLLADVPIETYKDARGAMPWQIGDEPAEVSIRRLRDA